MTTILDRNSTVYHDQNEAPFCQILDLASQCIRSAPNTNTGMHSLTTVMGSFAKTHLKTEVLRLINCPEKLQICASRSYRHANGQFKIVLGTTQQCSLRLNYWMPFSTGDATVHAHRWWMHSTVLYGKLSSGSYTEDCSDDSTVFDEYLYTAKKGAQAPQKVLIDNTSLRCFEKTVRGIGGSYVMDTNMLHQILPNEEMPCATLIVCSAPARQTNRLLVAAGTDTDVGICLLSVCTLSDILARIHGDLCRYT
jgi:hypothetical protein